MIPLFLDFQAVYITFVTSSFLPLFLARPSAIVFISPLTRPMHTLLVKFRSPQKIYFHYDADKTVDKL